MASEESKEDEQAFRVTSKRVFDVDLTPCSGSIIGDEHDTVEFQDHEDIGAISSEARNRKSDAVVHYTKASLGQATASNFECSNLTDTVPGVVNAAPWPIMSMSVTGSEDLPADRKSLQQRTDPLQTRDASSLRHKSTSESRPKSCMLRDKDTIISSGYATDCTIADEDSDVSPFSHTQSTASETSLLLPDQEQDNEVCATDLDHKYDEIYGARKPQGRWRVEAKVLARRSTTLMVIAFLQCSLNVSGIFTVGRLGKVELGAISLGSTTASITGYATFQGLVTSLDTLCAQAYGSGRKELVGLQLQRTILFLWCVIIPLGALWLNATAILQAIVPESENEVAILAGRYLKILLCGTPSLAAFEAGKRYLQAQGLFTANLYILLVCAPLNAFMSWLFVWQFKWGFVGAPIAIVITDNLLLLSLILYVRFVGGSECWGGFDRRAFRNWRPIIWLAVPGLVMALAEYLAFEILTLAASWISTSHLAAQAVLATIIPLMYQIPMSLSIAASTRIANLVGAKLPGPAKTVTRVVLVGACSIGLVNGLLLISLKEYLPKAFTPDEDVRRLVSKVLPICATFQLYDALAANCNGILRGIGRQRFGGWVCLLAYYMVGIPISFGTGFGLHWDLYGLWAGPAVALLLVAFIEGIYIYHTSWQRVVEEATRRNNMG